tara:strand:+ start:7452 stop:7670 length:219 start_codon:yes stop_codon:yes gene_type:complete
MDRTQEIIYDLLYSEEERLTFDITGMASHIEDYSELIDGIVDKVIRGDVSVIEDSLIINSDKVYWELKIKRK